MDETRFWLWLTMVFGTGSRRIWEAMCIYETAKEAYAALSDPDCFMKLSDPDKRGVSLIPLSRAEQLIRECEKLGIGVVGYSSGSYPPQLRYIMNPPAVLFYKGNIGCLSGTRTVTAVGTRNASDYGMTAAARICGELAAKGFVIVSGFAVGIDIASSLAAAQRGRPTACVLGCGVDYNYPKENFRHRDTILNAGGVFVSEYPPGTSPGRGNFPQRNRILAGLGRTAVVFEASEKSGSLITAHLALEQGRTIFSLPPADIFSESWTGNRRLLREGAEPLLGTESILDLFYIGGSADKEVRAAPVYYGVSRFTAGSDVPVSEDSIVLQLASRMVKKEKNDRTAGKKREKKSEKRPVTALPAKDTDTGAEAAADDTVNEPDLSSLEGVQLRIARALSSGTLHADILAQKLEMDAGELFMELTEMELSGIVRSLPGKLYELI